MSICGQLSKLSGCPKPSVKLEVMVPTSWAAVCVCLTDMSVCSMDEVSFVLVQFPGVLEYSGHSEEKIVCSVSPTTKADPRCLVACFEFYVQCSSPFMG